jgi:RNA polymerase sigma factor (sigma-70 family)
LTAQAFERLLGRLGGDAEAGGREYDALRRKLVLFFAMRGAPAAEDLADETIDRVARRLDEGEAIGQIRAYLFGVARRVLMEEGKRRGRELAFVDGLGAPAARPLEEMALVEARAECLQRCLAALPDAHRTLIVGYYEGEGVAYLKERKLLAQRLGISYSALKTQAHRVRNQLERCLRECLETLPGVTDRAARPR